MFSENKVFDLLNQQFLLYTLGMGGGGGGGGRGQEKATLCTLVKMWIIVNSPLPIITFLLRLIIL